MRERSGAPSLAFSLWGAQGELFGSLYTLDPEIPKRYTHLGFRRLHTADGSQAPRSHEVAVPPALLVRLPLRAARLRVLRSLTLCALERATSHYLAEASTYLSRYPHWLFQTIGLQDVKIWDTLTSLAAV